MSASKTAILALADGRVFRGRAFGAIGESTAEVVFNTAMTGYQEVLTDPSYKGQMVCMTCPEIGNVGINSDESVRTLKGAGRPLILAEERAEILASLECVDGVLIFDELTPQKVVAALLPDILVKGSDWPGNQIVGREEVEAAGGKVVLIDVVPGYSTTEILKKIRE